MEVMRSTQRSAVGFQLSVLSSQFSVPSFPANRARRRIHQAPRCALLPRGPLPRRQRGRPLIFESLEISPTSSMAAIPSTAQEAVAHMAVIRRTRVRDFLTSHFSPLTLKSGELSAISRRLPAISLQLPVLSSQLSVPSSQFQVFTSQFSVPSSQFSVLNSPRSAFPFRTSPACPMVSSSVTTPSGRPGLSPLWRTFSIVASQGKRRR